MGTAARTDRRPRLAATTIAALGLIVVDTTIAAETAGIMAAAGVSPVSVSASTVDAAASPAADAYAAFIALMRDVARAEGRVSDLHKERDEALARLRAARRGDTNADGAPTADDRSWNRQIDERMDTLSARYAADIAAAQARLKALQSQAAALRAQLP
jgi:hypothetical protein